MSPSIDRRQEPPPEVLPNLHVYGIGVAYPPYNITADDLSTLARRHYPSTPALEKVLSINQFTGIQARSALGTIDHPIANGKTPPTIAELCDVFLDYGVKLSVQACQDAVAQWGGELSEITHVVATTCTNSANPGFDHYVVRELGLNQSVEKVLLHGVGCSGGLAALRTAANLALGHTFRQKPARILVLACEISTALVRSELESIHLNQEVRIGVTLFSDCASAVVLSNGIGQRYHEDSLLELLGWEHKIITNTEKDLGFNVHPMGWKVVLTPQVPKLAASAVGAVFEDLLKSVPQSALPAERSPTDFDWALHPGGSTVIFGVQQAMGLNDEHVRACGETYMTHGNSSSATAFSVLHRHLRNGGSRDHIIGCAFGPGIAVEMVMFRRIQKDSSSGTPETVSGTQTPEQLLIAEEVD